MSAPAPATSAPVRPVGRVTMASALRLLREPFWLRAALAVVALSVAFVFLGRWQLHRHEAKVTRNTQIDANYAAAPVPIGELLPTPAAALPRGRQWTPVEVTGRYEPDHQVLIRNRPLDSDFGYDVVVPLRTPHGVAVLVDRGWLPVGDSSAAPDTVPAPPSGQVTVVVRLRPGEPPLDREPPAGQELRIDLARIAVRAGGEVYRGAYGVLATETAAGSSAPSAASSSAPTLLPRPDEDLGPHLAYAVQWWLGAVTAYVLLGVYLLKEAGLRAGGDGTLGGSLGGLRPARRIGLPGAARRRSRRREPTDEEWEDAADP